MINKQLINLSSPASSGGGTGNTQEGLILHLDANDVDSYDGDGTEWVDIANHEYTPATDVSEHFNTVIWTGDGSINNRSFTGVGFKPDFVWVKTRNATIHHQLHDSVLGATTTGNNRGLPPSATSSIATNDADTYGFVSSFDSDGFTVSAGDASADADKVTYTNRSSRTYAAWCLKAGGAPTATNTATSGAMTANSVSIDGELQSAYTPHSDTDIYPEKMSVNTKLGFSIIEYDSTTNAADRVPHGLDVTPELVIHKKTSETGSWSVNTNAINGNRSYGTLTTSAFTNTSSSWSVIADSNTTVGLTSDANRTFIVYSFASKRGVSKVGSYTGDGGTSNKIYIGFEPAFVMVKRTDSTSHWRIYDNKRGTEKELYANSSAAEPSDVSYIDFNRDGFTLTSNGGWINNSGGKFIYYAIAKNTNETQLTPEKGNFTAEDTVTTGAKLELDANDYSGSGNWLNTGDASGGDGTISGAGYVNDGSSDYFSFDGSSDVVTTTYDAPTGAKSLEVWFNASSSYSSSYQGVLGGDNQILWIGGNLTSSYSDESIYWYEDPSQLGLMIREGEGKYLDNKWHHLVIVDTGSSHKMYLDGEEKSFTYSYGNGTIRFDWDNLVLGRGYRTSGQDDFTGKIGQVRIYDTALTGSEIKANYDATYGLYQHADLKLHLDADSFPEKGESGYSNTPSTWTALTGGNATITGATFDSELGNYLSFDGTNDYMTLSGSTSLTDRTIEIWYRTNDKANNYWIFDSQPHYSPPNGFGAWALYIDDSYIYGIGAKYNSANYGGVYASASSIIEGKWHHIAFSCSNGDYRIYVDGEKLTNQSSGTYSPSRNIDSVTLSDATFMRPRIGYSSTPLYAEGDIGQIRIYGEVLTQSQIRQNFNFTKNNYPNGYNGTISGAAFNPNGYFEFNGTDKVTLPVGSPFDFSDTIKAFSFWIKPNTTSSRINPISISSTGNNSHYFYIGWIPLNSKFYIACRNGSSSNQFADSCAITGTTSWTHIVAQLDGSERQVWINGTKQTLAEDNRGSATSSSWIGYPAGSGTTQAALGVARLVSPSYSDGAISKGKVYDKALTSAQITDLYNEGE